MFKQVTLYFFYLYYFKLRRTMILCVPCQFLKGNTFRISNSVILLAGCTSSVIAIRVEICGNCYSTQFVGFISHYGPWERQESISSFPSTHTPIKQQGRLGILSLGVNQSRNTTLKSKSIHEEDMTIYQQQSNLWKVMIAYAPKGQSIKNSISNAVIKFLTLKISFFQIISAQQIEC